MKFFNFFKKSVVCELSSSPEPLVPEGFTEEEVKKFITSVRVIDAPEDEMRAYGEHDFKRFLFTFGLVKELNGVCLELGANPYFTTMLLKRFSNLKLVLANYFTDSIPSGIYSQTVVYQGIGSSEKNEEIFDYHHFNIEEESFPFADNSFDVVIFAEIIEHLLNDPCKVLREINRVLKIGGTLILTTPNVARLENVSKLIVGQNIYDPYSGYGPYGRHNREYTRHEIYVLCKHEGFDAVEHFTADVHSNYSASYFDTSKIAEHIKFREGDLGQYLFFRLIKTEDSSSIKRPSWLYRSYSEDMLD